MALPFLEKGPFPEKGLESLVANPSPDSPDVREGGPFVQFGQQVKVSGGFAER